MKSIHDSLAELQVLWAKHPGLEPDCAADFLGHSPNENARLYAIACYHLREELAIVVDRARALNAPALTPIDGGKP